MCAKQVPKRNNILKKGVVQPGRQQTLDFIKSIGQINIMVPNLTN